MKKEILELFSGVLKPEEIKDLKQRRIFINSLLNKFKHYQIEILDDKIIRLWFSKFISMSVALNIDIRYYFEETENNVMVVKFEVPTKEVTT